jgi:hypothetical protein
MHIYNTLTDSAPKLNLGPNTVFKKKVPSSEILNHKTAMTLRSFNIKPGGSDEQTNENPLFQLQARKNISMCLVKLTVVTRFLPCTLRCPFVIHVYSQSAINVVRLFRQDTSMCCQYSSC